MSSILPKGPVQRVEFFESREDDWQTNAVAIGTTSAAVTALQAKVTAAREAYNQQQLAFAQAKAATQTFKDAVATMTSAGVEIIKQVKAKAATGGNVVYTLALLPVPATPTPVPPPGTPTDFTATLRADGSLTLAWTCPNPARGRGTIYQVSRRAGGAGVAGEAGPFTPLGTTGTKIFHDTTLPAGAASAGGVTYRVVAVRSTVTGTPAQFTVNFGVSGETATVAQGPRLAA
jgi:hypothetical protein